MSKKEQTNAPKATPFYKKAVLPWLVITVAVVFFGGVLTGWTMRSDQESTMDSVRATALAEVQTVKK